MRILILLALLVTTQVGVLDAQGFVEGDTIHVRFDTYLRPEPKFIARGDTVAKVPEGANLVVQSISSDGSFAKVKVGASAGWLYHADFLAPDEIRREQYPQLLRDQGYGVWLKSMAARTNSAGGVTPTITFKNIDPQKTIKYIRFTLTPYNSVGDMARGSIRGLSTRTLVGVGPVAPGAIGKYAFDNAWYNETIACIEIRKIRVIYMNGSSFTYIKDLEDIRKYATGIHLRGECEM